MGRPKSAGPSQVREKKSRTHVGEEEAVAVRCAFCLDRLQTHESKQSDLGWLRLHCWLGDFLLLSLPARQLRQLCPSSQSNSSIQPLVPLHQTAQRGQQGRHIPHCSYCRSG